MNAEKGRRHPSVRQLKRASLFKGLQFFAAVKSPRTPFSLLVDDAVGGGGRVKWEKQPSGLVLVHTVATLASCPVVSWLVLLLLLLLLL
ncbi:unnamed protein product, partial [Gongylonema pulchrum]|uniref:Uncharacterized protein n=1 Tax=Gongylonema pulchrum TaxID=637853 RepID=A0A183DIA8_9BILA